MLRLKETQLNLLGQLEAATITVTLHVSNGVILRQWWITGTDPTDEQILCWSDSTGEGPHGGIQLAELLTQLLEVSRLVRNPADRP